MIEAEPKRVLRVPPPRTSPIGGGSIYHAVPDAVSLWIALSLLMTGVLFNGSQNGG